MQASMSICSWVQLQITQGCCYQDQSSIDYPIQNQIIVILQHNTMNKQLLFAYEVCQAQTFNYNILNLSTLRFYFYSYFIGLLMDQETLQFLDQIESKITNDDLTLKILLKPIQIVLKKSPSTPLRSEWKSRQIGKNRRAQQDSHQKISKDQLSNGLQIVLKKGSIDENKFDLGDFRNYNGSDQSHQNFANLKKLNQDNLISFLKPKTDERGLSIINQHRSSLAICVCMYNQSKAKLRDTLKGVEENLVNIIKSGVSCDNISVIVIIDGIETMNKDMASYFEEVERENDTLIEEQANFDISDIRSKMHSQQQSEYLNLNLVLFDEGELQERKSLKFKNIYKTYMQIRELQAKIQQMKKSHPIYDNLPNLVKKTFLKIAKQQYDLVSVQMGILNIFDQFIPEQIKIAKKQMREQVKDEQIISFSLSNMSRYYSILIKSLQQTEKYCEQYISSRENMCYLASFRKKIKVEHPQSDDSIESIRQLVINQGHTYMNLFVCVKYKNRGKLSSHDWFFNGFCKELYPKYTVLLDVGLRPRHDAIYKMYNYLLNNEQVGGVCGYMSLKLEKLEDDDEVKPEQIDWLTSFMMNFVDIQRAQQVQYHYAHLIDKPFQSQFDFIHVLPGAFSAYNMTTLTQINPNGYTLLKDYFKSIDQKLITNKITETKLNPQEIIARVLLPQSIYRCFYEVDPNSDQIMLQNENIYLAQDRILCMGIHKNGKKMHYLPDAHAEVDPIKNIHAFMGQRRRWINGSMFAFNKVKTQLKDIQRDCEFCLSFQMLYLTFLNALSYFSPSIFLFTVHLAVTAFRNDILPLLFDAPASDSSPFYDSFVYTIDFFYVILLGTIVVLSLNLSHNEPKFRPYIYAISTIFGLFQLGVFCLFVIDLIRSTSSNEQAFLQNSKEQTASLPGGQMVLTVFRWLLVSSVCISAVSVLVYVTFYKRIRILFDMIFGAISAIFYSPTYLIILNIFALCRIDDISWGTKGLNKQQNNKSDNLKRSWRVFKYIQVYKFLLWNSILGVIIISFGQNYQPRFFISLILVIILLFTLVIKIVIGSLYLLKYVCCKVIKLQENHIVHSTVLEEISVLRSDIFKEVEKNFHAIRQQQQLNNKKRDYANLLSVLINPSTFSKAKFMNKLTNNVSKIQSKIGQALSKKPVKAKRLKPLALGSIQQKEQEWGIRQNKNVKTGRQVKDGSSLNSSLINFSGEKSQMSLEFNSEEKEKEGKLMKQFKKQQGKKQKVYKKKSVVV